MAFTFTTEFLPEALTYMVQGMAGIFIVLFVLYLVCLALEKCFPGKK